MTVWQSIQLISPAQWAYAIGLAALFWLRGPSLVAWVLLADFLALLAIAAAMDFGALGAAEARWSMLVVWVATAAVMAVSPGVAKVMASVCVLAIAAFLACLLFGVQFGTTSAILNAAAFIILGVALIGMGGAGGGSRGHSDRPLPVAIQAGNDGLASGGLARRADLLSPDRGGLN